MQARDRSLAYGWGATVAGVILLRPVWLAIAPYAGDCRFRSVLGFPCPTCGATRVAVALLGGRVAEAFAVSPLGTVAAIAFVTGGLVAPLWAVAGGRFPVLGRTGRKAVLAIAVTAVLVNWAYLMAMS